jgi:hypothetical protein
MSNNQTRHKTHKEAWEHAMRIRTKQPTSLIYIIETRHWDRLSYWVTDTKPARCIGETFYKFI